jgi:hypothetical protein
MYSQKTSRSDGRQNMETGVQSIIAPNPSVEMDRQQAALTRSLRRCTPPAAAHLEGYGACERNYQGLKENQMSRFSSHFGGIFDEIFGSARGGHAMGLQCPHCGASNKHPVIKTDPNNYHWSEEHIELFKKHTGRDICFRIRERKCVNCEKSFETTEFPFTFLGALMKELELRKQKISELESCVNKNADTL